MAEKQTDICTCDHSRAAHFEELPHACSLGDCLCEAFEKVDPLIADQESFLDQVAECFDNGLAIGYETPFLDPANNQPITAGRLLERIRLGK